MLIGKNPKIRRRRVFDVGEFVVIMVCVCVGSVRTVRATRDKSVHRVAAQPGKFSAAFRAEISVIWTFVDGNILSKRSQQSLPDHVNVCVLRIVGHEIFPAQNPIWRSGPNCAFCIQARHILIVPGIHDPGEAQLPVVVQTLNGGRAHLGAAQGRQQHRRQDGDDGNHHQQLDQSETSGIRCQ